MNWRLKSAIQRFCAGLPVGSDSVYYRLQRHFGSLRNPPPPNMLLEGAASFCEWLRAAGLPLRGRRCMEVGTGRRTDLPFGLYLLGAAGTHTFDLTRYLRLELVEFTLFCMRRDRRHYEEIFLGAAEDPDETRQRISTLLGAANAREAMRIAGIQYRAPEDATKTGLPDGSIDLHLSYTVNEHIPRPVLCGILKEAKRVLSPTGVVLHHIDPSDHFAHDDPSISSINFLRFSEAEWQHHGGNKYAYHNRMRTHEHHELFEQCGYQILREQTWTDERALNELRNGFPLAPEFQRFTQEELAGAVIRILARPEDPSQP
ncbi:MAG: methyltransferase domain-containing protein [Bryobacteraceae bacterium]